MRPTSLLPQVTTRVFQGDNALSNLAMHSSHLIMNGVKQTMSLAHLINPLHWVNMVTKPFMEFME